MSPALWKVSDATCSPRSATPLVLWPDGTPPGLLQKLSPLTNFFAFALAELGINLPHILDKSLTVLNPLHRYSAAHPKDAHMMDDADLAGPLLFCFAFGMLLLLVSAHRDAIRAAFGT